MEQVFIFIFGTIIGSFLNVVILRYNTGYSPVATRSRCFNCGKILKWYELIPILSFLIQFGRCRKCRSKISWQYPLVELLTGILFLIIFLKFGYSLITGYWLLVISLLIVVAVYDLRHQIIPDGLVYAFDFLALLSLTSFYDFWMGTILFCFFGSLWLISRGKWMGLGDAKLALGLGWLLGLERGLIAVLFSFWLGAIFGIFLLFLGGKNYTMKSKIAFGPFLVLGTIIAFLCGNFF